MRFVTLNTYSNAQRYRFAPKHERWNFVAQELKALKNPGDITVVALQEFRHGKLGAAALAEQAGFKHATATEPLGDYEGLAILSDAPIKSAGCDTYAGGYVLRANIDSIGVVDNVHAPDGLLGLPPIKRYIFMRQLTALIPHNTPYVQMGDHNIVVNAGHSPAMRHLARHGNVHDAYLDTPHIAPQDTFQSPMGFAENTRTERLLSMLASHTISHGLAPHWTGRLDTIQLSAHWQATDCMVIGQQPHPHDPDHYISDHYMPVADVYERVA